jgi:hypothetical protein
VSCRVFLRRAVFSCDVLSAEGFSQTLDLCLDGAMRVRGRATAILEQAVHAILVSRESWE